MNLLTNARDALNEHYPEFHREKNMVVSASEFEKDGSRWVSVSVADNGLRIPTNIRHRIFDPFFTAKSRDKGSGLGLSISHGIVVEHRGSLSVDSVQGQGTTVVVSLPVDDGWELEERSRNRGGKT